MINMNSDYPIIIEWMWLVNWLLGLYKNVCVCVETHSQCVCMNAWVCMCSPTTSPSQNRQPPPPSPPHPSLPLSWRCQINKHTQPQRWRFASSCVAHSPFSSPPSPRSQSLIPKSPQLWSSFGLSLGAKSLLPSFIFNYSTICYLSD